MGMRGDKDPSQWCRRNERNRGESDVIDIYFYDDILYNIIEHISMTVFTSLTNKVEENIFIDKDEDPAEEW